MSAITAIELNYAAVLQQCYQNLCQLPGFVLLESTDRVRGRYDILSAYPYDQVIIEEYSTNKEELLRTVKNKLTITPSPSVFPFQGGAIGFVAYDLAARLRGISSSPQSSLANVPLLNLGFYDWAIIVDHLLKKVTLVAANRHDATPGIVSDIAILWSKSNPNTNFTLTSEFQPLISANKYEDSIAAIHRALQQGRTYQVNFTQPFQASFTGDPWEMYKKITTKNPVPFSAFMRTKGYDILCFSPERFILHEQGRLLTSPIKGTVGRSTNPMEDAFLKQQLLSSAKNRAENVMIVDLLRNDLGRIAQPGSVKVTNLCEIQSFSAVHHLVSDIEAQCLPNLHPFDAFMSCFPGGSITGAPKIESMTVINEQETYARGVYCGSIGYFSQHGRWDTNIAIRTVTAKDNILHLAAGGGIVIDSNSEDEYRECYTKIAAIINGLA